MKRKEKKKLINNVLDQYNKLVKVFDLLNQIVGSNSESLIHETVWKLFDEYIDCMEMKLDDEGEWLIWYIWENNRGKNELEAESDGKKRKVKNVNDLLWVMNNLT